MRSALIFATATGNCTTSSGFATAASRDACRSRPGSRPISGPEFVQERLARPETIPFFELPAKIEVARSFGLRANAFAMQFHSLVALPLLLVAMTLIAATVSMRFARMGQSATMILGGIVAGFLLYVVSVLVKAFGTCGIRAACCRGLVSGCGGDVFRGDIPALQGGRLVAVGVRPAPLVGPAGAPVRRDGAGMRACAASPASRRLRAQDVQLAAPEVPAECPDAARGRHAGLRQR